VTRLTIAVWSRTPAVADSITSAMRPALHGNELQRRSRGYQKKIATLHAAASAAARKFERALAGFERNLASLTPEQLTTVTHRLRGGFSTHSLELDPSEWETVTTPKRGTKWVAIDELRLEWDAETQRLQVAMDGRRGTSSDFVVFGARKPFEEVRELILGHGKLLIAINYATEQLSNAVKSALAQRAADIRHGTPR
jgi:hypothetical protein